MVPGMPSKSISCAFVSCAVFSCAFWLLSLVPRVSAQANEKTNNPVVCHSISSSHLQILLKASKKIMGMSPPAYDEEFSEVNSKISTLSEDIFRLMGESNEKLKTVDEILMYHNSSGNMLASVLNTILTSHKILLEIQKDNEEQYELTQQYLSQLNEKNQSNPKDACINIIKNITKNGTVPECENFSSGNNESQVNEVSQEILEMQNETTALVRQLLQQSEARASFEKDLQQMMQENRELRSKLRKRKMISRPTDCNDLRIAGVTKSGVYAIYPDNCHCSDPINVWCDMENEGGGWTVIVTRGLRNKPENFTRSWAEYEAGFGHPESEYWIGNSNLHLLTSNHRYSLRLEVTNQKGRSKWGQWANFEVGSAKEKYELTVNDYSVMSSIGNVFKTHNNQQFTTYDQDNDSSFRKNCAANLKGGWWYGKCYDIHPTGIMNATDIKKGVSTSFFTLGKSKLVRLSKLELKIKPKSCIRDSTVVHYSKPYCDTEEDDV